MFTRFCPLGFNEIIMKRVSKLQLVGITISLVGLIVLTPILIIRIQQQEALANAATVNIPAIAPVPAPEVISGHPNKITVPSLGINLPVVDGAYNAKTGAWTLTGSSAQYALPSTLPNNDSGNTLIYGHYNKQVFSSLHNVKPGAEVYVETQNGYRFVYKFDNSEALNPADTSVFLYKGAPRLTIQTCSGVYMQNRQMYYFSFVRYEKI